MRNTLLIGMVLAVGAVVLAGDVTIKNKLAKAAIERRDKAVADAESVFKAAVLKANKQLLADLEKAKGAAMRAEDLEEANAIDSLIAETEGEVDGLAFKGLRGVVNAQKNWQRVAVLAEGRYRIRAKGSWTSWEGRIKPFGPDGEADHEDRRGVLEGRFGEDGQPFQVGSDLEFDVTSNETDLFLRMRDLHQYDNSGSVQVMIERLGV
jgi:hypothetical protein